MLILGRGTYVFTLLILPTTGCVTGNSGFETASNIVGSAAFNHMASR